MKIGIVIVATLLFAKAIYASEPPELKKKPKQHEIHVRSNETLDDALKRHGIQPERRGISKAEAAKELTLFQKFLASKEAFDAKRAKTTNRPSNKHEALLMAIELEYMDQGKYLARVNFHNDANYPIKYALRERFKVDSSDVFFNSTRDKIFIEILGSDYTKFTPKLYSVTPKSVGIILHFENDQQLQEILTIPKLNLITHPGNPEYIEEIFP